MKFLSCLSLSLAFCLAGGAAESAASKPNILVILADDLGRAEYSAYGTRDIRTPNFDRLAREGMTFDNFYANSCVCSPTRAALLTGCHPDRVGVPGVIREETPENSWGRLSPDATLLPKVLKTAGYHSAIVGKWHLGVTSPDTPTERGFDEFHGFLGDMMDDYWTHLRHGQNFMRHNMEAVDPKGHATDVFTGWACDYLKERAQAKEKQPFFLYLAYNAPHDPVQPPPDWLEKVKQREPGLSEKRAKLVALIEHLDSGVGKVLDTLAELKLAEHAGHLHLRQRRPASLRREQRPLAQRQDAHVRRRPACAGLRALARQDQGGQHHQSHRAVDGHLCHQLRSRRRNGAEEYRRRQLPAHPAWQNTD